MRFILALLSGALLALAVGLAVLVVVSAADVSRSHALLSSALSPEARTEAAWDEALEAVTAGVYGGAARERAELAALNQRIYQQWQRSTVLSIALGAVLLALLLGDWIAARGQPLRVTRGLLLVSAVCLAVGIVAPMLSIVASREVPVLGQVVLRYESKSVVGTVQALLARGNIAVAALLALFSIVVPVGKLVLSAIGAHRGGLARRARQALHLVGRWSMTDVFVVAVLLAVLAGQSGDSTDAWVGHGLWFFLAYAVLSLVAARRLDRQGPGV